MNKFKKGDKINIFNGSWVFGIQDGKYHNHINNYDGGRKNLTVIETDLSVVKLKGMLGVKNHLSGEFSAVNDLLVTDNKGSFWFTQSRFCRLAEPNHTINIDGKEIVLSHKSYLALREQLV